MTYGHLVDFTLGGKVVAHSSQGIYFLPPSPPLKGKRSHPAFIPAGRTCHPGLSAGFTAVPEHREAVRKCVWCLSASQPGYSRVSPLILSKLFKSQGLINARGGGGTFFYVDQD